jgi:hypothetical protein
MFDTNKYSIILPARIVEYFPEDQTATVQICAERTGNTAEEMYKLIDRKPIKGIPVHTPGGGGWHMTFPVAKGDSCIILFSQVGYDHWFYKDKDKAGLLAGMPNPILRRKFSEDDGFVFVGINTIPRKIASYSADHSQWRNASVDQYISLNKDGSIHIESTKKVTVKATDVEITGNLKVTGTIEADGEVSSGSVTLTGHTHSGSSLATTATIGSSGTVGAISGDTETGAG